MDRSEGTKAYCVTFWKMSILSLSFISTISYMAGNSLFLTLISLGYTLYDRNKSILPPYL